MTAELPNKLSDLIVVALADLKACEQDDKYIINMGEWHRPMPQGVCFVCLAGAVMAQTCKIRITDNIKPYSLRFRDDSTKKFKAINAVRVGDVRSALLLMGVDSNEVEYHVVDDYHSNPVVFVEQMNSIVEHLQERGL